MTSSPVPSRPFSDSHTAAIQEPLEKSRPSVLLMPLFDDPKVIAKTHHNELQRYLVAYHAKTLSSSRSTVRQKLTRLAKQQFHELTTDVYDELMRRKTNPSEKLEALPPRQKFHPKRNQARQKLATLPTLRFQDLSSDVYFELSRRYPELKDENHGGTPWGSGHDDMQYPECHASPWPDSPTLPLASRISQFSKETRVDNEHRSLTFDRCLSEADFARRQRSREDAYVSNPNRHEVDSWTVPSENMPRITRQQVDYRLSASPSISIYGDMARTQFATAMNPDRITLAWEGVEPTHRRKGSQDSWVMVVDDDDSGVDGNTWSELGEKHEHSVSTCDLKALNARSMGQLSDDVNDEGDGGGSGDDGFDKVSLEETSMTFDRSSAVNTDGRVSVRGEDRDWLKRGYDSKNAPVQNKTVTLERDLENIEQRDKALLEARQHIELLEEEIDGFRKRAEKHETAMRALKEELDELRELRAREKVREIKLAQNDEEMRRRLDKCDVVLRQGDGEISGNLL